MSLPNQLSLLRIVLTPFFAYYLLSDDPNAIYVATAIFIVASITDWYDGYFARRFKRVTKWGKFLDPLADKILIATAFFVFWSLGYIALWVAIVILARDIIITLLRLYAIETRKPVVTSNLAKWKTFSQIFYICAALLLFNLKSFISIDEQIMYHSLEKAAFIVAILTLVTGIIYLVENRGHLWALISRFFRVFIPSDL
ncbi:CDP-diacylglycerol--glycerol-3-phosphate 3-phosphatidyltransferase [candidate division KSB1 bacterium]